MNSKASFWPPLMLKVKIDAPPLGKYFSYRAWSGWSGRLEGLPRHTSMHAAGVVICPEAADHFVPLSRGSDGSITTQFTMTTLEELGLLKMDFLGLRTLTVIDHAVKMIEHDTGVKLDMEHLDYNDKKVLDSPVLFP